MNSRIGHLGDPKTQFGEGATLLIRFLYENNELASKIHFFCKFGVLRWCLLVLSLCLRAQPVLKPQI